MTEPSRDWTRGGDRLVYQQCAACGHAFYFHRSFCPECGTVDPATKPSEGRGVVHASTLVQRATSDEFRAIAPYRIVLVDLAEGVRVMAHGAAGLRIGDTVRGEIRTIAGRLLPYFQVETHAT